MSTLLAGVAYTLVAIGVYHLARVVIVAVTDTQAGPYDRCRTQERFRALRMWLTYRRRGVAK